MMAGKDAPTQIAFSSLSGFQEIETAPASHMYTIRNT